jgi:hypothetical protein
VTRIGGEIDIHLPRGRSDMFGKPKDNPTEAQPSTFTCAAVTRLASRDLGVSSISSSITIVGKISGKGTVRISGRIEGDSTPQPF